MHWWLVKRLATTRKRGKQLFSVLILPLAFFVTYTFTRLHLWLKDQQQCKQKQPKTCCLWSCPLVTGSSYSNRQQSPRLSKDSANPQPWKAIEGVHEKWGERTEALETQGWGRTEENQRSTIVPMARTDSILYAAAVGDRFRGIIPPAVHCLLISTACCR